MTNWTTTLAAMLLTVASPITTPTGVIQDTTAKTILQEFCSDPLILQSDLLTALPITKTKAMKSKKTKMKIPSRKEFNCFFIQSHVNMDLKEHFLIALTACKFPEKALITSGLSFHKAHSKRSQHKCGEAIDIDWENNGKAFFDWMESSEGESWLEKFNLDFKLEKVPGYKKHPKYLKNRKATGSHIHLYIKK